MRVLLALILCLSAGCAAPAAMETPPAPAAPAAVETPPAPAATLDPATAEAQAFRLQYGLRADLAWIALVAADPAAKPGIAEWGVPLTPAEITELRNRRNPLDKTATELLTEIRAYGARFPESFADAYLDQRVAIGFVVMFSRDVDRHRVALRRLFPPIVELDVREVRWSLAELEAFRQQVQNDPGWLALGPARLLGVEVSWLENAVHLRYLGPADRAAAIAAYYGNPPWLSVVRAGALPWNGPRADLVIDVAEADGSPAVEVRCDATTDDPEAREGSALKFATDATGQCVLAGLPVGAYEVVFERWVNTNSYERYEAVHSVRVTLRDPGTRIRVVLPPG